MLKFHSSTPKTGHKGMRVLRHNGSQSIACNRTASNIVVVDEPITNYSPMSWEHIVESGMYFTRRMSQPHQKIRYVDLWPGDMCIVMSTTDDQGMGLSRRCDYIYSSQLLNTIWCTCRGATHVSTHFIYCVLYHFSVHVYQCLLFQDTWISFTN